MTNSGVLDQAALASLLEMTGGDQVFLAELIDTYGDDGRTLLATMQTALGRGDAAELRRAAHSLKSNSATFGAAHLAALCQELEARGKASRLDGSAELLARAEAEFDRVAEALRAARPVG